MTIPPVPHATIPTPKPAEPTKQVAPVAPVTPINSSDTLGKNINIFA